jgi:ferritin-like metal-binding protein YciE
MTIDTLADVYAVCLGEALDCERELVDALDEMADAAQHEQLKRGFETHRDQTRTHAERVERLCAALGGAAKQKECAPMRALIDEGKKIVRSRGKGEARDAALIVAAQRVEHFEIATYGSLRALAAQLGRAQDAREIEDILADEEQTDKKLTALAVGGVNAKAAVAT